MTDDKAAPYAALLLRLAIGVALVAHGALKVFVFTIPGTVQFFESIGYPGFMAYLVILAELGGGTVLLLCYYWYRVRVSAGVPRGPLVNGGWRTAALLLRVDHRTTHDCRLPAPCVL